MSVFFVYILKLSASLAVIFLFYRLVLRKLTFYNWNRWYLLLYTLACFFIPFIDITPVLHRRQWTDMPVVQIIPAWDNGSITEAGPSSFFTYEYAFMFLLFSGIFFMICRLTLQLISFRKMLNKAEWLSGKQLKIYQVNEPVIPFSFGQSVFINRHLHSAAELEEIIRHEFVHVKQMHSLDIIWAEVLCMLSWYNPFAWLLKKSIRQNLEFIADNKVLDDGLDKKEYQYLLLKVIGNSQYSIAASFNFSSLKKRIAMMNKSKSKKRHLGRFLLLLPVVTLILLSFRKTLPGSGHEKPDNNPVLVADTIPDVKIPNSKGYYIDIKDNNGNCMVVIKDKNKKEVKRLLLTEWNEKPDYYSNLYGEILSPQTSVIEEKIKAKNPDIKTVVIKENTATVTLKNGQQEVYTLSIKDQKKAFEERCGLKEVAVASPVVNVTNETAVNTVNAVSVVNETIESDVNTEQLESVQITNKVVSTASTGVYPAVAVTVAAGAPVKTTATTLTPSAGITKDEELFSITQKTTREELETLKKKLDRLGFELAIDMVEYENEILKKISGIITSGEAQSRFEESNFSKLVFTSVKKGEKTYFRINVIVNKKTGS